MKPTTMLFRNLMAMDVEECIRAYPLDGGRPALGLRQDHAGHAHGRGLRRRAGHSRHRRSHAATACARPGAARLRHRHLAAVGGASRGTAHRGGVLRAGVVHVALGRALHGDGHRLHHGLHGARRSAWRCPAMPPFPPPTRGAWRWPRWPAAASSRWPARPQAVADPHRRGLRQRHPRRTWPSAAPPTPSSTWSPSPAAPGVPLPLTRFDELSRRTPLLVNVKPSGKYLMEDFFYAGGLPAGPQRAPAAAARRAPSP
mgnify:CR=1 FL=1